MALETGSYINDLVTANPPPGDPKSQGDDHIRLLKTAAKNCFPGFAGSIITAGVSAGAANTYTLTPTTPLLAYSANMMVLWKVSATNSGASTLNISALGARAIKRVDGTPVALNDLPVGQYVAMVCDGTDFFLIGITKSYIDNLAFSTVLPAQAGNATKYLRTDGAVASWDNSRLIRSPRAVNAILADADGSRLIAFTAGNFTQTFTAAATLGNGWWSRLKNDSTGDIEIEAPAAVSTTSSTSNSIAAGTAWTLPIGLAITAGDLIILRRTSDPFAQRLTGTVTSYNSGTGALVANPDVRYGGDTFTDWTITTRAPAAGIDGKASYVMYPGESRDIQCDAVGFNTTILSAFYKKWTIGDVFITPPGYREIGGRIHGSGNSGQRTNNVAVASCGGGGAGSFPIGIPVALIGASAAIVIGAGGLAVSGVASGNLGGTTSFGSLVRIFNNATFRQGGSVRQGLTMSGANAVGFEGGASAAALGYSAVWGGGATSSDGGSCGGSTYGGGAGGSLTNAAALTAPGTSLLGGSGGAASSTGNGSPGVAPGGGGGSTQTGTQSGAGAIGELQLWGVA